jgi:hypothetical protein
MLRLKLPVMTFWPLAEAHARITYLSPIVIEKCSWFQESRGVHVRQSVNILSLLERTYSPRFDKCSGDLISCHGARPNKTILNINPEPKLLSFNQR